MPGTKRSSLFGKTSLQHGHRLERLARDEHSSLFVNKKLYDMAQVKKACRGQTLYLICQQKVLERGHRLEKTCLEQLL
jgi:hypothetical protein